MRIGTENAILSYVVARFIRDLISMLARVE